jgi:hypothetical protein
LCVKGYVYPALPATFAHCGFRRDKETPMNISDPHITPIVALVAGILILIVPRLLSFIVAVYLIIIGLNGLNAIHHFIR